MASSLRRFVPPRGPRLRIEDILVAVFNTSRSGNFIDCVADEVTPEAGGRDGLVVTAKIEVSLKSLQERRPVRMDELLNCIGVGPTPPGEMGVED